MALGPQWAKHRSAVPARCLRRAASRARPFCRNGKEPHTRFARSPHSAAWAELFVSRHFLACLPGRSRPSRPKFSNAINEIIEANVNGTIVCARAGHESASFETGLRAVSKPRLEGRHIPPASLRRHLAPGLDRAQDLAGGFGDVGAGAADRGDAPGLEEIAVLLRDDVAGRPQRAGPRGPGGGNPGRPDRFQYFYPLFYFFP